ncbi:hypothetical protein [Cryptosporangium sp. NPDC051539]|uniref:hypothetical protein n=1 Tax=Cryptosporangium sp. NPDC051539 TaxID=3363962 RepID=UPI003796D518
MPADGEPAERGAGDGATPTGDDSAGRVPGDDDPATALDAAGLFDAADSVVGFRWLTGAPLSGEGSRGGGSNGERRRTGAVDAATGCGSSGERRGAGVGGSGEGMTGAVTGSTADTAEAAGLTSEVEGAVEAGRPIGIAPATGAEDGLASADRVPGTGIFPATGKPLATDPLATDALPGSDANGGAGSSSDALGNGTAENGRLSATSVSLRPEDVSPNDRAWSLMSSNNPPVDDRHTPSVATVSGKPFSTRSLNVAPVRSATSPATSTSLGFGASLLMPSSSANRFQSFQKTSSPRQ